MKIMKNVKFITVLSAFLVVAMTAYAATATNGGTAPRLDVKGVEYFQPQFWTNGPSLTSKPITNVSYTYRPHRVCSPNPLLGGCTYMNVIPSQRYLCLTTTQTGPIEQAPDLRCINNLLTGTNSTDAFNGIMINSLSKRPRWFFSFIVDGAGGLNPVWEGQPNSVTVTW